MGKLTDALKKAAQERLSRIERHPIAGYRFIARKTADSKIEPHIVTFYEPDSAVSEQYRILRTNIQSVASEKPIKAIVVTSSVASEGKTVTAVNLAISMAQDLDNKSVLLIDADLRKGKVDRYLGLDTDKGLADILSNGLSLEEALLDIGISNLTIIPSGEYPKNPAELLGSLKMRNLLESLRQQFDYIIIDTPPVISLTDPGILGSMVDGVVMVVQAGRTQKSIISHSKELLRQARAKVLGYVLTNVQYHLPEYLYRYIH